MIEKTKSSSVYSSKQYLRNAIRLRSIKNKKEEIKYEYDKCIRTKRGYLINDKKKTKKCRLKKEKKLSKARSNFIKIQKYHNKKIHTKNHELISSLRDLINQLPNCKEIIANFTNSNCFKSENTEANNIAIQSYDPLCDKSKVKIPFKINERDVTTISTYAFSDMGLWSINIPNSIVKIERMAFYNNKISQITIPSSVQEIEEDAFSKNDISRITIGDNVKFSGNDALPKKFIKLYRELNNQAGSYKLDFKTDDWIKI